MYYNAYVNDWMLSNLGRLVIIYSVAGIIGNSFKKAFTKQNIEKGFHVTDFVH
jgi:ABC-type branched-subunit amino acid transport system substrate-binding protein